MNKGRERGGKDQPPLLPGETGTDTSHSSTHCPSPGHSLAPGPVANLSFRGPSTQQAPLRFSETLSSPLGALPLHSFSLAQGTLIPLPNHPPILKVSTRIYLIQKDVPRHPKLDGPSSALLSYCLVCVAFFSHARVTTGRPNPVTFPNSPKGQHL